MFVKLQFNRWRPELVGLIAISFFTRLWNLFMPNAVVFDEVYFKAFAGHYLDGRYYFDIHPPLGKLVEAGWAHLLGMPASALLNGTALPLRILPAIAGAMLVPLVWGILRRLRVSRPVAFITAFAVLLDNLFLVESRFILMDSALVLAGVGALYFYLRAAAGRNRMLWLAFAAASAGTAASIKWTGLTGLALVVGLWAFDNRRRLSEWQRLVKEALILLGVPILIYVSSFWLHFALLPHSGDGDAFMTSRFQQTLVGGQTYTSKTKMPFWDKFIELNVEMYNANRTLTATHPYGSKWYTWPLEIRDVYYWQGIMQSNGKQGNIYLLGNPIVWWGVIVAFILGLFYVWRKRIKLTTTTVIALSILGLAYLINFLPFAAVPRVMFIYHYLFALLFSLMFVAVLWDAVLTHEDFRLSQTHRKILLFTVCGLILFGFIFIMPLSYGTPLTPKELQMHMILPSWR